MDALPARSPTALAHPSVNWQLGTIGFGYDDWQGPFYPPGLKSAERLSFYAQHFNTVELDTTFHAAPTVERIRKWASLVPSDFRFCPKTPRAITHDTPLVAGAGPMNAFADICREFGPKLGVILIQFAPQFDASQLQTVDAFLEKLPRDVRFAAEFRHRSWGVPDTLRMLHRHNVTFVSAEYRSRPSRVFATTDQIYVRWIGEHGKYESHERELGDVSESLQWWDGAIAAALPKLRIVWGFFNNDYAGYGVGTANRFKRLAGLPVSEPVAEATLFG